MKKLFFALLTGLIIPGGITSCMEHEAEHEESPAKRQKIEAPEKAAKFIEVKREIDTPAGTREIVVGYINLEDTEGFTHATFQELIEEKAQQGKSAIFAMAKTYDAAGQAKERFYDAYFLLQSLFGSDYFTVQKNRYNSPATDFKDIITRQPLIGDIQFFIVDENNIPHFLGTDYHLHVLPKSAPGQTLINALKKNIETEAFQEFYAHGLKLFTEGRRETNFNNAMAKFYRPALEKFNLILASEPPAPLKAKSQIIKGIILINMENPAEARTLLKQGLEQGVDDISLQLLAQDFLAQMLKYGEGGEQDLAEARNLYAHMMQHAEDPELPENLKPLILEAQLNLARMLEQGKGGPPDPEAAREFYEKLAHYTIENVEPVLLNVIINAKYRLARMLEEGQGGEPSDDRARALYEEIIPYVEHESIDESVKSHLVEAIFYLAQMLKEARGGHQDLARARQLFEQVEDTYSHEASLIFRLRAGYQHAQILEMDENKDWETLRALYAWIFAEGAGLSWPDEIKQMALEAGYKLAQIEEEGLGGPLDLEDAREIYENISQYAEDTTVPDNIRLMALEAQYKLALLLEGFEDPQNRQRAHELYQKVIAHIQNIELPANLDYLRTAAKEGSSRTAENV